MVYHDFRSLSTKKSTADVSVSQRLLLCQDFWIVYERYDTFLGKQVYSYVFEIFSSLVGSTKKTVVF